jgi:outer membrane murein-binding lipoprotein Lpp
MKKVNNIILIFLLAATILVTGCSSSKKSNCGCPNKKGMVGY